MWPFLKKPDKAEIIERDETAIETIEVRDIRQYLVDEYERAAKLKDRCEMLAEEVDAARITEAKYQAALVTLDEYASRLKNQEAEIDALEFKLDEERKATRAERDAANTLRIKLNRCDPSIVADETRKAIAESLLSAKGGMSRKRAADIALGKELVTDSIKCEAVNE